MDTSATLSKGGVPHQKDSLWIEFPPFTVFEKCFVILFVRNLANMGGGEKMRKESVTVQKCKKQMASLGFDSQLA